MNNKILFLLFSLCICSVSKAETTVFSPDEKLKYRAHYGLLTAGYADFETRVSENDSSLLYTVIDFNTANLVDKLYKINYKFEAEYDPLTCLPVSSAYRLEEGNKSWSDRTEYHIDNFYLISEKQGMMLLAEDVRDIVSAIFYVRTINWNNYQLNDTVSYEMYFREKETFPLKLVYKGKELVDSEYGKISCVKLQPLSDPGKLFNGKSTVAMWVSDDENGIPIRISMDVLIGSFKFDLVEYENIKIPYSCE